MKDKESFLDREHTEILEALQAAYLTEGSTKRIFSEMLSIFSYQLDREEETVMPLLHYLSERVTENHVLDYPLLRLQAHEFSTEFDNMLSEHQKLSELAYLAGNLISSDSGEEIEQLGRLKHHMLTEEEILYPAAKGAVELLEHEYP